MEKIRWTDNEKKNAEILTAYQAIKELYKDGKITKTQLNAIKKEYNISID